MFFVFYPNRNAKTKHEMGMEGVLPGRLEL